MGNTVIPTLGSHFVLSKPQDKIEYVLKYYAVAPKSMSNTHIANAISLGDRISTYGDTATSLLIPVEKDLHAELTRVFPEASSIDVEVRVVAKDARNYALVINPTVTISGMTYSISRSATVVEGVLMTTNDTIAE